MSLLGSAILGAIGGAGKQAVVIGGRQQESNIRKEETEAEHNLLKDREQSLARLQNELNITRDNNTRKNTMLIDNNNSANRITENTSATDNLIRRDDNTHSNTLERDNNTHVNGMEEIAYRAALDDTKGMRPTKEDMIVLSDPSSPTGYVYGRVDPNGNGSTFIKSKEAAPAPKADDNSKVIESIAKQMDSMVQNGSHLLADGKTPSPQYLLLEKQLNAELSKRGSGTNKGSGNPIIESLTTGGNNGVNLPGAAPANPVPAQENALPAENVKLPSGSQTGLLPNADKASNKQTDRAKFTQLDSTNEKLLSIMVEQEVGELSDVNPLKGINQPLNADQRRKVTLARQFKTIAENEDALPEHRERAKQLLELLNMEGWQ